MELWGELSTNAAARKKKLDESFDFQRFLNDLHHSTTWIADMKSLIKAEVLANDVASADALLHRHAEHKSEIDARQVRQILMPQSSFFFPFFPPNLPFLPFLLPPPPPQESFQNLTEFGDSLIMNGHFAAEELQAKLDQLRAECDSLDELWQARKAEFDQCRELQLFARDAEQIDTWITAQEAILANENLGDSLDTVEALVKKHDDFEKTLAAQEEKTRALDQFAQELIDRNHYDKDAIQTRRQVGSSCFVMLIESFISLFLSSFLPSFFLSFFLSICS